MQGAPTNWDAETAVANAFNAGLDLDTGNKGKSGFVFNDVATQAVKDGRLTTDTIDTALSRSLMVRFAAGAFDPTERQQYTKIGAEMINASQHWAANLDAAQQGLVLLTNNNTNNTAQALPLRAGIKLAVVGPHAVSQHGLFSDYANDQMCWDGKPESRNYSCIQTIGDALLLANGRATNTKIEKGVAITGGSTSGMAAAVAAVGWAEAVVLALGTDVETVEHEGHDRADVGLPTNSHQVVFAAQVLAAAGRRGIPVILVVCNGGAVSIDGLLDAPHPPAAVIEAFFPGPRGAEALARAIFGIENRWGRLPYSILRTAAAESFKLADANYSMANRTYRYAPAGSARFDFGHGLSYTDFSIDFMASTGLARLSLAPFTPFT